MARPPRIYVRAPFPVFVLECLAVGTVVWAVNMPLAATLVFLTGGALLIVGVNQFVIHRMAVSRAKRIVAAHFAAKNSPPPPPAGGRTAPEQKTPGA